MQTTASPWIDNATFHADVDYLESHWQRTSIGPFDLPIIDIGNDKADLPLVCVPILEHLEFVYARQVRTLSQTRRVILYRRRETRTHFVGLAERVEELRQVLDGLGLAQADLLGHGDAAMVLFEFALRYPARCRSLIIIAQGADYQIAPHPFIWLLHELYLHIPVEYSLPATFLRRTVINYITERAAQNTCSPLLPYHLIEEQFAKIATWPFVYKFSVLPIIHAFDIRARVQELKMPILLINRTDDALSPEQKTHWLAEQLPNNVSYRVVEGGERFFMYSRAEVVTPLIEAFLATIETRWIASAQEDPTSSV